MFKGGNCAREDLFYSYEAELRESEVTGNTGTHEYVSEVTVGENRSTSLILRVKEAVRGVRSCLTL